MKPTLLKETCFLDSDSSKHDTGTPFIGYPPGNGTSPLPQWVTPPYLKRIRFLSVG